MGLGIFGHPRLCTLEVLKRIAVCICLHLSVSVDITEKDASPHMVEGLKLGFFFSEFIENFTCTTYSAVKHLNG